MSVLIKGMEMPQTCDDCFLPLCYCPYAMKPDGNCPLVEVPPHGRLIDADTIHWIEGKDEQDKPIYLLLKFQVEELPTIIESEEE